MDDPNMHAYSEASPDDAEIGRQWREDSSLETWFPLTAERLAALEALLRQALDALEAEGAWGGSTPKGAAAIASLREALGPNARGNAPDTARAEGPEAR